MRCIFLSLQQAVVTESLSTPSLVSRHFYIQFYKQETIWNNNMNTFTFTLLLVVVFFRSALGSVISPLQPREQAHCLGIEVWPDKWWGDWECTEHKNMELLIPSYWNVLAKQIPDTRFYGNYDKIICAPEHYAGSVCAFLEGMPEEPCGIQGGQYQHIGPCKMPGSQVKRLFEWMSTWCWKSRCGEAHVDKVEGPVREGTFKINGVHQMGNCRGLCKPWECTSFSQVTLQC